MSLEGVLFWILAISTTGAALGVVISQSIIRSAVWLLFTLVGVAFVYLLLGALYLGATQLIVYVGGTLVLVVFGAMLTGGGPFMAFKNKPWEWIAGGVVATGLLVVLVQASLTISAAAPPISGETVSIGELGLGFLGVPERESPAGRAYLLPFEIVSVHLLVVLIAAAYLARAKKRVPSRGGSSS